MTADHRVVERIAANLSGASLIDLSDQICPGDPCPVILRGMIVYRDYLHLTATFAASLAGALADSLPVVGRPTLRPEPDGSGRGSTPG